MPPIDIDTLNLPQQGHPLAGVVTAGQPSASQFSAIKAAGVSKVINLRPATEDAGFDEAAVVQGLGVCGLGRRSPRSLVAVMVFMSVAVATVFVSRHVLGG